MTRSGLFDRKNLLFAACCMVALLMFFGPLKELTKFSIHSHFYSHIWLVPLVSLYFFFTDRKRIFSDVSPSPNPSHEGRGMLYDYDWKAGMPVILAGVALFLIGGNVHGRLSQNDYTAVMTSAAVVFLNGSFLLCYGYQAYKRALFPLLFLVFMIPIPAFVMRKIIDILLVGSGASTEMLFKLTGTPYIREGLTFHLPGISIEVADVCSGIRSSLALFITIVIAAHMFLKTNWKKLVLLLAIYPITVFKNGVRIITISLLAVHIDERFLTDGFIHKSGGFIFFIPSLIILGLILWALRRSEEHGSKIKEQGHVCEE